jgi:glycine/D-amino acid oxidase-like deaminating enzyme
MMRHQPIQPRRGDGPSSSAVWHATAAPGPDLGRLVGAFETDVLVVGGGIAGLSTALHLAEAGIDVVVIEAGQPGSGATGQSGGLVAPDYIRHSPETIGKTIGRRAGERLTRFLGESAQYCFDLIDRHGIECDSRQDGFWSPAHTEIAGGDAARLCYAMALARVRRRVRRRGGNPAGARLAPLLRWHAFRSGRIAQSARLCPRVGAGRAEGRRNDLCREPGERPAP